MEKYKKIYIDKEIVMEANFIYVTTIRVDTQLGCMFNNVGDSKSKKEILKTVESNCNTVIVIYDVETVRMYNVIKKERVQPI